MRQTDVIALFEYNYWANWTLLEAAAGVSVEQFTAPTTVTWRNLRGTLVHTMDVEQSWRRRLQGEPKSIWTPSYRPTDSKALKPSLPTGGQTPRKCSTGYITWTMSTGNHRRPWTEGSISALVLPVHRDRWDGAA